MFFFSDRMNQIALFILHTRTSYAATTRQARRCWPIFQFDELFSMKVGKSHDFSSCQIFVRNFCSLYKKK